MKKAAGKWLKGFIKMLIALFVLAVLALLWGFLIEPTLLTVTEIKITDKRLPEELDGIRAVFFSDLHVGSCYSEADAERVAGKIKELNPDIVLFGGDLTQKENAENMPDGKRVSNAFAGITPRYGKYAVYGNHDIWPSEMKPIAHEILTGGGFTVLENQAVKVADGFYVAGAKPWPLHRDQMGMESEGSVAWPVLNGFFTLLLAHEPAQIDSWAQFRFPLQLSGHTHGGQVSLPFIGPLATTYATEGYHAGMYKVNNTKLYVSRGVGVITMRVRFCAPPEIVVVTLHKNSETAQ